MQKQRLAINIFLAFMICIASNAYSDEPTDSSLVTHPEDHNPTIKSHAFVMHGEPKYPADFQQFDYTSLDAPKGGRIKLFSIGTFDSLNKLIAKGQPVSNIELIYDTLTKPALDEPSTQYGLLAHTIEYPEDHSWVIFHLRPEARFHDQHPITSGDVVFTFNLLQKEGNPAYKFYYADVEAVEALGEHKVKYTFKNDRGAELILSLGTLPILPEHFWQNKTFSKSSLEIPLGSGPYRIDKIDPARNIIYKRVGNYWGKNLPVNRGFYNFEKISVDYYRDNNVAVEGLKAGEYDYRREISSKFWATSYDIPAIHNDRLIKKEIRHKANSGLQGFVFNLRKPIFQDIELRKAISYAFDFEWSNEMLFYKAYQRSSSFFNNSVYTASGFPDNDELVLLSPFKDQLPESIFTQTYVPPKTDGSGRNRPNLRIAKKILDNAGYKVKKNQLYNSQGQAIKFEILIRSPGFERIVNPFVKSLSRLGIIVNVRLTDNAQYINRNRSFDFDMIVNSFRQVELPGNEQRNFWGSDAADIEGSSNLAGIKNPAVDYLIEKIIDAKTQRELVIATRALDRVLLHHHYVIPQWYKPSNRIIHWDKFGIPDMVPVYDRYYETGIYTWWYDSEKAQRLNVSTDNRQ